MLKTMLRNIKRWKRNRRVLFAWLNLMLFDKRTSVKRNTENVCFTSNETGLGLKFSIHCAIVRISTCFFSEKKIQDQVLTFFFPYKSNK